MKKRTIVSLEPSQILLLKRQALVKRTSISALVRQAINSFLKENKINQAQLILESVKEVAKIYPLKTGQTIHLSKEIDEIVYG